MRHNFLKLNILFLFSAVAILIYFSLQEKTNNLNLKTNFTKLNPKKRTDSFDIEDAIHPPCFEALKASEKSQNSIKKINIIIPNSREWSKNLVRAYAVKSSSIPKKFKRKFDAIISFNNQYGEDCSGKARIRLHGDYKDHIDHDPNGKNIYSSMDIRMIDDHIQNFTKFKLFLPETRKGDNEVFLANLLKEIGLLSPRTSYVDVDINGKKIKMILQEKLTKELLESNQIRESILIETGDDLIYKYRQKKEKLDWSGPSGFNYLSYPKILNRKWMLRGEINKNIAMNALNHYAIILDDSNKNNLNETKYINYKLLNPNNFEIIKNELNIQLTMSIITKSIHSLFNINRKFIYRPFYAYIQPIYYDGNSTFLDNKILNKEELRNNYLSSLIYENLEIFEIEKVRKALKNINNIHFAKNLNAKGLDFDSIKIQYLKDKLLKNLDILETYIIELKNKKNVSNIKPIKYTYPEDLGFAFNLNQDNTILCSNHLQDCDEHAIDKKEYEKLITGLYKKNDIFYIFKYPSFELHQSLEKNSLENIKKDIYFKEKKLSDKINIRIYGEPKISINNQDKEIKVYISQPEDKIVIYDSKIDNYKVIIKVKSEIKNIPQVSRFDENLLTSTFTILDSEINNIQIYSEYGVLEDSVNVVRSYGNIESIEIKNSFQDALDLDFSDLEIKYIKIVNAGNDCLDVSSGRYIIEKLEASYCNDKGISAGEKAKVKIKKANISNSKIAITSKDSAFLKLKELIVEDAKVCAAVYRKKIEYGGGILEIPKNSCKKDSILVQINSNLIEK